MSRSEAPARAILRTVLIVVSVVLALYLIYLLRRPLTWLVVAGFLAIALSGPVNLLSRRMKRGLAMAIVYLALLLLPVLLGGLFVPPIVNGVQSLADNAPGYAQDLREFVAENETLRNLEEDYQITQKLQEEAGKLPGRVGDAAAILRDVGFGLVDSIFALFTIVILSAFLVGSGRRWIDRLIALQPADRRERMTRTVDRIAEAVGNYVGGALVQATIAGITTYIVLLILGVPFRAPLAVLVFLFDLIPLVGATIAAVIVGIVTVFTDFPTATIVWSIWAIVYQQIENNLIQPQIQKRAVNVHPFAVLVAVLFGSTLFGIGGALLAIPIAAAIQISLREWFAYRAELRSEAAEAIPPEGPPTAIAPRPGTPPPGPAPA